MNGNHEVPTYLGNPKNIKVGNLEFYFDEHKKVWWLPNGVSIANRSKALAYAKRLNHKLQEMKKCRNQG